MNSCWEIFFKKWMHITWVAAWNGVFSDFAECLIVVSSVSRSYSWGCRKPAFCCVFLNFRKETSHTLLNCFQYFFLNFIHCLLYTTGWPWVDISWKEHSAHPHGSQTGPHTIHRHGYIEAWRFLPGNGDFTPYRAYVDNSGTRSMPDLVFGRESSSNLNSIYRLVSKFDDPYMNRFITRSLLIV